MKKYNINQDLWLLLWTKPVIVSVVGIHENLTGKFHYDLIAAGRDGKEIRMRYVDADHVTDIHPDHK